MPDNPLEASRASNGADSTNWLSVISMAEGAVCGLGSQTPNFQLVAEENRVLAPHHTRAAGGWIYPRCYRNLAYSAFCLSINGNIGSASVQRIAFIAEERMRWSTR
jgi:hypothetical protein